MRLWIVGTIFLVLGVIEGLTLSHAWSATPAQIKTCSVALPAGAPDGSCGTAHGVSACGPLTAADSTYTKNAAGTPIWQPFSALVAASPVFNCSTQLWTTLALSGATVPATPPPASATHDYTVFWGGPVMSIQVSHSGDGGKTWDVPIAVPLTAPSYTFPGLPVSGQCFRIEYLTAAGPSDPTVSCPGSQAITVQ